MHEDGRGGWGIGIEDDVVFSQLQLDASLQGSFVSPKGRLRVPEEDEGRSHQLLHRLVCRLRRSTPLLLCSQLAEALVLLPHGLEQLLYLGTLLLIPVLQVVRQLLLTILLLVRAFHHHLRAPLSPPLLLEVRHDPQLQAVRAQPQLDPRLEHPLLPLVDLQRDLLLGNPVDHELVVRDRLHVLGGVEPGGGWNSPPDSQLVLVHGYDFQRLGSQEGVLVLGFLVGVVGEHWIIVGDPQVPLQLLDRLPARLRYLDLLDLLFLP
mmetsp:Transcript_35133/g.79444  ORF Transcript_35133/g.79444 Transcript_35133/m.79444 type:complete len:264 (+) Transcript_35133:1512-2303(+)